MKVEFHRHNIEREDVEKLEEVLDSLFLTTGAVTSEFEQRFAEYTGLPHVVGLTSCTAALHLSLLALGIGPGDEVITTPLTFIATATAILHTGAKLVFVDVEPDTGLIDPAKVKGAITSRTKAIVPVHLYGTMADMKALAALAKAHGLWMVEDCAHCIEGERDGVRPGHFGDVACYSFYATKNLTSGEGGAVATRNEELAEKIRLLRLHGMNKDAASRHGLKYRHWDMETLGWKYNMDNIHAALLVRQIERLGPYWERRRQIAEWYREGLKDVPSVLFPEIRGKGAYHLQTVWVDPKIRDEVMHQMQKREVGVAVNYRAIHTLTFFKNQFGYKPEDFPSADEIGRKTISLPLYPKLTGEEAEYVVEALRSVVSLLC